MDWNKLSELLYPDVTALPDDWERKYPPRVLPEGAKVTRFAPSPTGFVHMGALFPSFVSERLAHDSGGIFYLRIEDTDEKRAVEGGVDAIINSLAQYGVFFDEGAKIGGENGAFGPYRQRERVEIYHTYAKSLVAKGFAYPCFCSESGLAEMREKQESDKANFGYYGKWAICRNLSIDSIEQKLRDGVPFVLRLRVPDAHHPSVEETHPGAARHPSAEGNMVVLDDPAKGRIEMPANDIDHVLLKSDGVPTYHFAHAVDDHLMGTTHVVRGDEWLATYPLHHMLFDLLGFKRPHYIHIAPLMKLDDGSLPSGQACDNGEAPRPLSKRKLSKRKDPECALTWYAAQGYPASAVREYIMTLLNSNFEDWRRANLSSDIQEFPFSPKKMNAAGALFDIAKLDDVSKNVISRMTAQEVYDQLTAWAEQFDPAFHALLTRSPAYSADILGIGRGGAKPRKDITRWGEAKTYMSFFFDELFEPPNVPDPDFCRAYAGLYNPDDQQDAWFQKIKSLGEAHGYCPDVKRYKADPSGWKGSVADASMSLRLAVTGRESSPDMYAVMRILGTERVIGRLMRV